MRRIKKGAALALVLMFAVLAVIPDIVHGAVAIDTKKEGSITFDVSGTKFTELTGEGALPVTVHLYRVASVSENGRFAAEGPFETALAGLDAVSSQTSAEEWQQMAEEAAQVAEPKDENGTPMEGAMTPGWTTVLTEGKGRIPGDGGAPLLPGLYLALAQSAESSLYRYTFQPALVALPGNAYYETGTDRKSVV